MIAGYPLHPPPLPKTREYAYRCQTYPHVSQLDQAVACLRAHRPFVNLVTINLGSNDVIKLGFDAGLVQIQQKLPLILAALRDAVGPDVPIVGMNYYQPFVVAWFDDPALAHDIVDATVQFNDVLEASYTAAGSHVADVETAFSVTDFTIQPDGLPLNLQRVCQWTLMCTVGDPHPNDDGSGAIARVSRRYCRDADAAPCPRHRPLMWARGATRASVRGARIGPRCERLDALGKTPASDDE